MRSSSLRNLVLALCFALAGVLTLVATAHAYTDYGPCFDCGSVQCEEGLSVACVADGDNCSCQCIDTCDSPPLCGEEVEVEAT